MLIIIHYEIFDYMFDTSHVISRAGSMEHYSMSTSYTTAFLGFHSFWDLLRLVHIQILLHISYCCYTKSAGLSEIICQLLSQRSGRADGRVKDHFLLHDRSSLVQVGRQETAVQTRASCQTSDGGTFAASQPAASHSEKKSIFFFKLRKICTFFAQFISSVEREIYCFNLQVQFLGKRHSVLCYISKS